MSGGRANVCLWHTANIPEYSIMSSFERKRRAEVKQSRLL